MQRRLLHTDRIRSAGYDPRDQQLEIEFTSGEVRVYQQVPDEVARRFFASANPATYWEDRIAEEYPSGRGGGERDADARAKLDALFGPKKT